MFSKKPESLAEGEMLSLGQHDHSMDFMLGVDHFSIT